MARHPGGRSTRTGIIEFDLFRDRAFSASTAITLLTDAALFAVVVSPTMLTLYHSLSQDRVPAATTANAIIQQIGGALGTASVALLLQPLIRRQGSEAGGFHATFWVVVGLVVLTAVPATLLAARRKRTAS